MSTTNKYGYDYERNRKGIYVPVLKGKNFNPSPVAGRIPHYADGDANPSCIGTSRYESFWDEQFEILVKGYYTGGLYIPGPLYWFLNFTVIKGGFGPMYPFFCDLHYDIEYMVDQVKKFNKTGFIMLKKRRAGISELNQSSLHYGVRFIEGYKAAVTAGIERYTKGIHNKFNYSSSCYSEALRLNVLQDNIKEYNVGYEVKTDIGGYQESGSGSQILWETMFDNPNKLEGEYFHDVIMEEGGQYKALMAVFDSIKPALTFGSKMFGMFRIYGTGGNILGASADFKEMYDNAETYGLVKMFVPANRMFFPFFVSKLGTKMIDEDNGETIHGVPNLKKIFKGKTKEEVLGMEDTKAADEYIEKKIEEYSKLQNKTSLKKFLKANPRTEEEAWTSGGKNNFNEEKLITQLLEIEGKHQDMIKPYILEYVYTKDQDGNRIIKEPREVIARPAKKTDPDWEVVWILEHPQKHIKNLDIGGVDGYNQDQTLTSKSLGAMAIIRQTDVYPCKEAKFKGKYPIFLYYNRPPKKELFFELGLKASIYYGLVNNTMIAAESDLMIDYYLANGGRKYLSPRPRNFDSAQTKQRHTYGVKVINNKDQMLGALQGLVEEYCDLNYFPKILRDFLAYDEEYIGTDWDAADAMGCAMIRIVDKNFKPINKKEKKSTGRIIWREVNGNMLPFEEEIEDKKDEDQKELKETTGNWVSGW